MQALTKHLQSQWKCCEFLKIEEAKMDTSQIAQFSLLLPQTAFSEPLLANRLF